ncbi:MAG: hypothetical protein ACREXW_17715 [Gammaproteobacteria bacterium]
MSCSTIASASIHVVRRVVAALIAAVNRCTLVFEGQVPIYARPVLVEWHRPNVYPRKSKCPCGMPQVRVFSSFTTSLSRSIVLRIAAMASSAEPLQQMTKSSA